MGKSRDELEAFFREGMGISKKKPSFEEVFQKTLDETIPSTPGDLRNSRKWQDKPKEEFDEWL
jgi:hypothetical protein